MQLFSGYELDIDCSSGCTMYGVCTHSKLVLKDNDLFFVTSNGRSTVRVKSFQTAEMLSETPKFVASSKF